MSVDYTDNSAFINSILSVQASKDEEIKKLLDKLDSLTSSITEDEVSNNAKYNSIVSCEYILVRLRVIVETEHINIKRILADPETPQVIKPTFVRRDQYLAQVIMKLNSFREDISVLQKVVYTNSNFIKR